MSDCAVAGDFAVAPFRQNAGLLPIRQCGTTLRVVNRDAERRATILQENVPFGDHDRSVERL